MLKQSGHHCQKAGASDNFIVLREREVYINNRPILVTDNKIFVFHFVSSHNGCVVVAMTSWMHTTWGVVHPTFFPVPMLHEWNTLEKVPSPSSLLSL